MPEQEGKEEEPKKHTETAEEVEPVIEDAKPEEPAKEDDLPDEIPESLMKLIPSAPREPLTEQQLKDMDRVAAVKTWVM